MDCARYTSTWMAAAIRRARLAGELGRGFGFLPKYTTVKELLFDQTEFKSIRWFHRDELPLDRCDPHMGRFVQKIGSLANHR
jgi:hypothetical protein